MFTGIIEEVGAVSRLHRKTNGALLCIKCKKILKGLEYGDSVAVDGVCLTVKDITADGFLADVIPATLKSTNLGRLLPESRVNLERALKVTGRLNGHIVLGHVDGTGIIKNIEKDNEFFTYYIAAEQEFLKYVVQKGSVAVDGISLTVQGIESKGFSVSIIPATLNNTALKSKKLEDEVNIETDILGKYMEKFLNQRHDNKNLTLEKLISLGY